MGLTVSVAVAALCGMFPQQPVPAGAARADLDPPELLLVTPTTPLDIAGFGLGSGGTSGASDSPLRVDAGQCTTPGGVQVRAQVEGVLIEFPNKAQLLFAPDGYLHLRDGGAAGPFPGGASFHFADGSELRIDRSGSRRRPLQEVAIVAGARTERLWWAGRAVAQPARAGSWNGIELVCGGDGTTVYRCIGLGPLLVFERLLAPADSHAPEVRAALCTEPLLQSVQQLRRDLDHVDPEAQSAVAQLSLLAAHADAVLAGSAPPRTDNRHIRYSLPGGYELAIELGEGGTVLLGLCIGDHSDPLLEWSLGYTSELHLLHPRAHQTGAPRYYREGVALPRFLPEFAARSEQLELQHARAMLKKLLR